MHRKYIPCPNVCHPCSPRMVNTMLGRYLVTFCIGPLWTGVFSFVVPLMFRRICIQSVRQKLTLYMVSIGIVEQSSSNLNASTKRAMWEKDEKRERCSPCKTATVPQFPKKANPSNAWTLTEDSCLRRVVFSWSSSDFMLLVPGSIRKVPSQELD